MSSPVDIRKMVLIAVLSFIVSSLAFAPILVGNVSTAQSSASSASEVQSDFNGDGYEDLAISAPEEDVGSIKNAGSIHILYGSSSGLQTTLPQDQLWTQDSPGVDDTAEEGDRFGMSLAAGDFNNDGYDDLAAGAPWENSPTRNNPGAVNVLYGSSSGLQTSAPPDQFWSQDSPSVDDAGEFNDFFGGSVAASDFNGDGFDDLAIGADHETLGSLSTAGATHVLYGSASGLQTSSPADQFWTQDSPGVSDAAEAGDAFGGTLAGGDFNNDGYADLAIGGGGSNILGNLGIGAGAESVGTVTVGGAVNVLYGSSTGLRASASGTTPDDQFWNQNSPGVNDVAEERDFFGSSLAIGDFNDDAFDDLAIGVFEEDIGSVGRGGAVHVLYGSSAGLQTSSPADQFWNQNSPGVEGVVEHYDSFGASAAAGDFNSDGFDDLAIGAPRGYTSSPSWPGEANVLYGSSSGLQTSSPSDQLWTQDSPGVEDTAENHDDFGSSVTAGDFNGDGHTDLAIAAVTEAVGTKPEAGAVNVLYGSSASGLQTSSPADQFWNQDTPGVEENAVGYDFFGYSLG